MRFKLLFLAAFLFVLQGCEFGGGTAGDGLTLTGVIVDPQGAPVAGAKVRLYPEAYILAKGTASLAGPRRDSTVTDASGRFTFVDVAKGRYNLEASALLGDSIRSVFIPGVYVGGTLDLGTKTVQTTGGIRLRVETDFMTPLAGAQCHVVGSSWETVSDGAGDCVLTGLPPGQYKVLVAYPGKQSVVLEDVLVTSGSQANGGTARLLPASDGTDTTWTVRYRVEGEYISALAWSGSTLVAVGEGVDIYGEPYGLILTSPDGITWTKRDAGASMRLNRVIWAGNQFVAMGDRPRGSLWTSPNGIAWTKRPLSDSTWPVTGLAWSGTRIVVTTWNTSMVSTDGITWVDSVQSLGSFSNMTYAGGFFIGIGSSGIVQTSPDGLSWTSRDAQTTNSLNAVAWRSTGPGTGQFVAVGNNGTIRTSADGITWEKRVSGTTNSFSSIVWLDGRWIVDNNNLQSTDGILWTAHTPEYYISYPSIISIGTRRVGLGNGIVTSP
jgi:hypothetical protein